MSALYLRKRNWRVFQWGHDRCLRKGVVRTAYGNPFCTSCWKQVLEDIEQGRTFSGIESLKPIVMESSGKRCDCRRVRSYQHYGGMPYKCCQV